jgi:thiamine pyrophosphate-dependent acetolactate synthase large subunit-like protein
MACDGLRFVFGNPGTVEQGLLDALADAGDRLDYIFALQESVAVGIADGYARARTALGAEAGSGAGAPAIVQLHTGVGLGNGIGMLYQALRGHAPLVVLAGNSGVRYEAMDAQMAADLVAMARPVTKWAARVTDAASVLRMFRRAVRIACTPPYGPTFLALPADVLDQRCEEPVHPTSIPITRVRPESDVIGRMADALVCAERPLIIMGDGVAFSGASGPLATLADQIGAEVWGANSSEVNIPFSHPLFAGLLGHMFGSSSRRISSQADVVLICGTYVFPEVFPDLSDVFASGARILHVDLNAYEIAKNFPIEIGVVADPKATLAALTEAVSQAFLQSPDRAAAASERRSRVAQRIAAVRQSAREQDQASAPGRSHSLAEFSRELTHRVDREQLIVFDEALTSSPGLCRYLYPPPGHFFQTRGGSLGLGIPGAIGVKLARPDKTVFGFTGDGASLYTIQALWTAAHHNVGAKFVVCNNHGYLLLKLNILQYWREQVSLPPGNRTRYPMSFDITDPPIDFVGLAHNFGVAGERVTSTDGVGQAIERALQHDGPYLIDLDLGPDAPNASEVDLSRVDGSACASPACGQ